MKKLDKKEYKVLIDRVFALNLSLDQTISTLNHLNDVIHEGYDVVCITKDGVVIVE